MRIDNACQALPAFEGARALKLRLVTHLDISSKDIELAVATFRDFFDGR